MIGPTIDGPTVSAAGASRAVAAAVRRAEELGVAVVVWVVDPGGHDVAMLRMDRAPLLSRQVARDKAWSAVAFGQPTTCWATLLEDDPALGALGRGNRLMPVPGGVPLRVGGALVGGIGVSGATAEQDGDIADTGAVALTDPD